MHGADAGAGESGDAGVCTADDECKARSGYWIRRALPATEVLNTSAPPPWVKGGALPRILHDDTDTHRPGDGACIGSEDRKASHGAHHPRYTEPGQHVYEPQDTDYNKANRMDKDDQGTDYPITIGPREYAEGKRDRARQACARAGRADTQTLQQQQQRQHEPQPAQLSVQQQLVQLDTVPQQQAGVPAGILGIPAYGNPPLQQQQQVQQQQPQQQQQQVRVPAAQQQQLQILIKADGRPTITVSVASDAYIAHVRAAAAARVGAGAWAWAMNFCGKPLKDHVRASAYNMRNGDTVRAVTGIPGGDEHTLAPDEHADSDAELIANATECANLCAARAATIAGSCGGGAATMLRVVTWNAGQKLTPDVLRMTLDDTRADICAIQEHKLGDGAAAVLRELSPAYTVHAHGDVALVLSMRANGLMEGKGAITVDADGRAMRAMFDLGPTCGRTAVYCVYGVAGTDDNTTYARDGSTKGQQRARLRAWLLEDMAKAVAAGARRMVAGDLQETVTCGSKDNPNGTDPIPLHALGLMAATTSTNLQSAVRSEHPDAELYSIRRATDGGTRLIDHVMVDSAMIMAVRDSHVRTDPGDDERTAHCYHGSDHRPVSVAVCIPGVGSIPHVDKQLIPREPDQIMSSKLGNTPVAMIKDPLTDVESIQIDISKCSKAQEELAEEIKEQLRTQKAQTALDRLSAQVGALEAAIRGAGLTTRGNARRTADARRALDQAWNAAMDAYKACVPASAVRKGRNLVEMMRDANMMTHERSPEQEDARMRQARGHWADAATACREALAIAPAGVSEAMTNEGYTMNDKNTVVTSYLYSDDSVRDCGSWAALVKAVEIFADLSIVTKVGMNASKSLGLVHNADRCPDPPHEWPDELPVQAYDLGAKRTVAQKMPVWVATGRAM
eukprot:g5618.t1